MIDDQLFLHPQLVAQRENAAIASVSSTLARNFTENQGLTHIKGIM
jgi:hypothetical protein